MRGGILSRRDSAFMKKSEIILNRIVLIVGILCILYYVVLGLSYRFGQSLQFLWLVVGGLCIARFILWTVLDRTGKSLPWGLVIPGRILIAAALVFFFVVEGMIFAGSRMTPIPGQDYIIVLGARVDDSGRPSPVLRNRIVAAADYMKANPQTIAVLTGGKGSDEKVSEAQCIYNELTAMGIDSQLLIMEERASDTEENLRFSHEIIGDDDANVSVVTNDFHVFRARCIARKQEWNVNAVPVPTSIVSFPHYMMREFIGVVVETLQGKLVL